MERGRSGQRGELCHQRKRSDRIGKGTIPLTDNIGNLDAKLASLARCWPKSMSLPPTTNLTKARRRTDRAGQNHAGRNVPDDFDAFWDAKLKELARCRRIRNWNKEKATKPNVDYWKITLDNIRRHAYPRTISTSERRRKISGLAHSAMGRRLSAAKILGDRSRCRRLAGAEYRSARFADRRTRSRFTRINSRAR